MSALLKRWMSGGLRKVATPFTRWHRDPFVSNPPRRFLSGEAGAPAAGQPSLASAAAPAASVPSENIIAGTLASDPRVRPALLHTHTCAVLVSLYMCACSMHSRSTQRVTNMFRSAADACRCACTFSLFTHAGWHVCMTCLRCNCVGTSPQVVVPTFKDIDPAAIAAAEAGGGVSAIRDEVNKVMANPEIDGMNHGAECGRSCWSERNGQRCKETTQNKKKKKGETIQEFWEFQENDPGILGVQA